MITEESKRKFEQIVEEIKSIFPDTTTSLTIKITAAHTKLVQVHRYPEELKKSNIAMRNIKGDFIKSVTPELNK
jgi:hypothetical protein